MVVRAEEIQSFTLLGPRVTEAAEAVEFIVAHFRDPCAATWTRLCRIGRRNAGIVEMLVRQQRLVMTRLAAVLNEGPSGHLVTPRRGPGEL